MVGENNQGITVGGISQISQIITITMDGDQAGNNQVTTTKVAWVIHQVQTMMVGDRQITVNRTIMVGEITSLAAMAGDKLIVSYPLFI